MLLFGAFVRAQVCWCSVWPGGSDRAGGCGVLFRGSGGVLGAVLRNAVGGSGRAVAATPCGGRRAWPRAPEGLAGGGRFALCVARAEPRLCPHSLGARRSWGGGAASWENSGRQSPGAVEETIGGVGPRLPPLSLVYCVRLLWGPYCLKGQGAPPGEQQP